MLRIQHAFVPAATSLSKEGVPGTAHATEKNVLMFMLNKVAS